LFAAQIGIGLSQGFGYPVMMGMSIEHVPDDRRTTALACLAVGLAVTYWLTTAHQNPTSTY
jgi:predicted MFS family arabinose efflux permease